MSVDEIVKNFMHFYGHAWNYTLRLKKLQWEELLNV